MWDETIVRVRYAETDKMGIVHHANYYVWFELGRSEYCRARGFSYLEMEEKDGLLMVVAESQCRYISPAFYEDLLTVRTKIEDIRSRSLTFTYEVFRESDNVLLAKGLTKHLMTDQDKSIRRLPEKYRVILSSGRE
ncbi:MAG: acyl-CoA thioesterase [Acidobacteria bacterium]|nr:acyl-CoA thioesterase [Acidobacteriota bacterium]